MGPEYDTRIQVTLDADDLTLELESLLGFVNAEFTQALFDALQVAGGDKIVEVVIIPAGTAGEMRFKAQLTGPVRAAITALVALRRHLSDVDTSDSP